MTSRRDLHRAVDGELSKSDTRRIEADPLTREELDRLRAVAETPGQVVRPVKPPAGFKRRVLDGIRRSDPKSGP